MSEHSPNKDDEREVIVRFGPNGPPPINAKAQEKLAERLEARARESHIPLPRDRKLTGLLAQIPLANEIPASVYRAISALLTFTYEHAQSAMPPPDEAAPKKTSRHKRPSSQHKRR